MSLPLRGEIQEAQLQNSQGGEKRRNEIGMNAQLVQDRLFIVPVPAHHDGQTPERSGEEVGVD
jgi:hypothetical protein